MIELIFMGVMLFIGAATLRVIVLDIRREHARYKRIVDATAKKHAKEVEALDAWLAKVRQIQQRGG